MLSLNLSMNNTRDFEGLLAEYRNLDLPALPGSFPPDVLREIRLRKTDAVRPGCLSGMFDMLRPGMVAASLGIALAVGAVLPGIVWADNRPAASDLNVFSIASPHLPSGILSNRR